MIDARCKGVRILPSLLATQTTPYFTLHPNIDPVGVYKPSLSKVGKLGRGRKEKREALFNRIYYLIKTLLFPTFYLD